MIQALSPRDLVELSLLPSPELANQARSKALIGKEQGLRPLATLLAQWLPLKVVRHSLVWREGGRLRGLVSARSLSSPKAWEIDYLAIAPEELQAAASLLERLSALGAGKKTARVFLRLELDSPLVEAAIRADFAKYATERLYLAQGRPPQLPQADPRYSFRPEAAPDEPHLFTLYSVAIPTPVRQAQGMTRQEWRDNRDESLPGKRAVCLKGDSLVGWFRVRATPKLSHFEVMAHPDEGGSGLESMLAQILAQMPRNSPLACIVPQFQSQLALTLSSLGFEPGVEHACFVKQLTVPVTEPRFAPARA
ncbi:MAG TPA: hypothetical protein G4O03_05140 [Dehalococcoidia bacterium]|nr:hypothetical protein [Dehalococcoidia bacterium]